MHVPRFASMLCLLLFYSRADDLFVHVLLSCQFTSPDDAFYSSQLYFNKKLLGQFNSTLGKYEGYTEKAKEVADGFNKDPRFLTEEQRNFEKCKANISDVLDFLSETNIGPDVRLRSAETEGNKGIIVCSAYNFYPKQIRLTWLRNGEEETSDVMSTEELANGNWLYQIHSYLEYTPRLGETITCMVEHASYKEPKRYDWDPRPKSVRTKIVVGMAGLLLGVVFLTTGLIYYNKNHIRRMLVPTAVI